MSICAVVLAAGKGRRLAPLTTLRPKPLCPVGNRTLLDRTLDRLAALGFQGPDQVAVNAHHHANQLVAAVAGRAHVSVEQPIALGTAGAIAALRDWIAGRDVLVCNADAYLSDVDTGDLLRGWSGERTRLLVTDDETRGDFDDWRFAGMSLLPARAALALEPVPSGLYEVNWRSAWQESTLELVAFAGVFVDCGTPADYLAANLHAAGTGLIAPDAHVRGTVVQSVVGPHATVEGIVERSVIWPGASVSAGEHLVESIRAQNLTISLDRAGETSR